MELGGNNRRSSEVQGPRPSPLKIKKESHKMMKKPIIIYTVSPKIIHTTPADFMNLVQRLTGSNSSISNILNNDDDGIGAPIQKPTSPHHHHQPPNAQEQEEEELLADIMGPTTTTSMFHGMLSPGPTSLFHDLNFMEAEAEAITINHTPSTHNYLLSLSPHTHPSIDIIYSTTSFINH